MATFSNLSALAIILAASTVSAHSISGLRSNVSTGDVGESNFFAYANCYAGQDQNKNGIIPEYFRWPKGVIPYEWHSSVSEEDKTAIKTGIKLLEDAVCLRVVPRDGEVSYITFRTDQPGCSCDATGMRGGPQEVILQRVGCLHSWVVAHEILHAAGLFHEQCRGDRDEYIKVHEDNIKPAELPQFQKCSDDPRKWGCSPFGFAYNVKSIMHYPGKTTGGFEIDSNKPTMSSLDPSNPIPDNQNEQLTAEDIGKIKIMYNNCQ